MTEKPVTAKYAASVIILRPSEDGPEILFLRRNPSLKFHGDFWVFPGGRIDPEDYEQDLENQQAAARRAAIREAKEEAGLTLAAKKLTFAVHWTTPESSPIRFATWFFVTHDSGKHVTIDGEEILDHQWLKPADALKQHTVRKMKLAAPTFALTTRLAQFQNVSSAVAGIEQWSEEFLLGRLRKVDDGTVALYHQDIAYEGDSLDQKGPRHRLWMIRSGWNYERNF